MRSVTTRELNLGSTALEMGDRTLIMGVVNVTPDSFFDGGRYLEPQLAIAHGLELERQGAAILDVGGESTRPGAQPVSMEEELTRVIPVVEGLAAQSKVPVSIDTFKPEVARAAVSSGATLINDITGLRHPAMVEVAMELGVPVVVMHMLGDPGTMQSLADPASAYGDVVTDIIHWLEERLSAAEEQGLERHQMLVDPGLGFGKTVDQNLELLARLGEFRSLGCPLLVGPSRKSFIGAVLEQPVDQRVEGTLATVVACALEGVEVVRVHDVAPAVRVAKVADAIRHAGQGISKRGRDR